MVLPSPVGESVAANLIFRNACRFSQRRALRIYAHPNPSAPTPLPTGANPPPTGAGNRMLNDHGCRTAASAASSQDALVTLTNCAVVCCV